MNVKNMHCQIITFGAVVPLRRYTDAIFDNRNAIYAHPLIGI